MEIDDTKTWSKVHNTKTRIQFQLNMSKHAGENAKNWRMDGESETYNCYTDNIPTTIPSGEAKNIDAQAQ